MAKQSFFIISVFIIEFLALCYALETPSYNVVHSESDFEIRLYGNSSWMSAPVREVSFQKATVDGFNRLFKYIQGGNLNCSQIPMTSPVLTSIVPGAGPFHSWGYSVNFYLPEKFQADPPIPLAQLRLKSHSRNSTCVGVRKFSGFAVDSNVMVEAEKLAHSLKKSSWANFTTAESGSAFSIAQYDPPFKVLGRLNEVWVDVKLSFCKSDGVASY